MVARNTSLKSQLSKHLRCNTERKPPANTALAQAMLFPFWEEQKEVVMAVSPLSTVLIGIYLLILAIQFIGALLENYTPAKKGHPANSQPPEIEPSVSDRIYGHLPIQEKTAERQDQKTLAELFCRFPDPRARRELEEFRIKFEAEFGETDITKHYTTTVPKADQDWLIEHHPKRYLGWTSSLRTGIPTNQSGRCAPSRRIRRPAQ
jgi:hypothetical protein